MSHTPGPWAVAMDDHEASLIATVGSCGARRFGRRFDQPHEVNYESHTSDEADAALCAAAPELLEALQVAMQILSALRAYVPAHLQVSYSLSNDTGNEALAKVRGDRIDTYAPLLTCGEPRSMVVTQVVRSGAL